MRFHGIIGRAASAHRAATSAPENESLQTSHGAQPSGTVAAANLLAEATGRIEDRIAGTFGPISVMCIGKPVADAAAGGSAYHRLDAEKLAERFRAVGARIVDDIQGPFALFAFDSSRSLGIVATDRMGIQPVFFKQLENGIAFGSSPEDVLFRAGAQRRLSEPALFAYLYAHVIPAPHSIFEGVARLLPGECIELEGDQVSRRLYWQPAFVEDHDSGFAAFKEQFMNALRGSVEQAMDEAKCGAFLSGGTDSSTIAGFMAKIGREPPMTFSIGFKVSGYDELEYARLASSHFKTRHHEYYVTPRDIVDALPQLAVAHPQPFGNSSGLPTYLCARLAKEHGVQRLLAGDGGDELFGGNARYAKQYVFSLYERVPRPLRDHFIGPACRAMSRHGRPPLIGKAVSYVEQASTPMPARLESYNLLGRIGYAEVVDADLLASIDTTEPARLNEQAYFNPTAGSLINRMLALDFKTTLADSDLPKVVRSCELAGVDVAFPMLDSRIVDFSLSLPPAMKLKGTKLRYFFKRALEGFLPEAIIRKTKHGFGLPFGEWAVKDEQLRALTFDTLSTLKRRNLIRPGFIDQLTSTLLPQHPNYYGTMAWILMSLELWLENNMDNRPTAVRAHAEPA